MAKLYFYYAAMNAGKSTTLLQSAHNYEERNMRTLLFTPKLDDRFGEGKIASRIGLDRECEIFTADDDLYVAALDGTATGHEINNAAGTAKLYTAADTIDLIANTATFDGKVRVFAVIAELGTAETAATFA